jgi:general secretion pathway protein C
MKLAFAYPTKNTFKSTSALKSSSTTPWSLRLITLLMWMSVGLCAAYWAFKFVTTKPVVAAPVAAPTVVVDSKAIGKLLGASDIVAVKPVVVPVSTTKYLLFGIASTVRGTGVALIGIDDKPARPYRLGSKVADDLVLKSLTKTKAVLAASATAPDGVTLELPVRKPATLVASANRALPPAANPVTAPAFNPSASNPPAFIPPAINPPSIPPGFPPGVPPGVAARAGGVQFNVQSAAPDAAGNAQILGMTPATAAPSTFTPTGQPPVSRFAPRALKDGEVPAMPTATSSSSGER